MQKYDIDHKSFFYGALAVVTLAWIVSIVTRRIRSQKSENRPSTPDVEKRSPFKAPQREPGGTVLSISPSDMPR
jgi:hypothetical protein